MNTAALGRAAASPAPTLQAAPVPAKPTAPDRVPARAAPVQPFADLLRRERAGAAPPAPQPSAPESAVNEGGVDDAKDEAVEQNPEKPQSPARTKARSAAPARSPAAVEQSLREGSAVAETRAQEERAAEVAQDRPGRSVEPTALRAPPELEEPTARHGSVAAGFASKGDAVAAGDLDAAPETGARAQAAGRHGAAGARLAQRADGNRAAAAEFAPAMAGAATPPTDGARSSEAAFIRPWFELPMHAAPLAASLSAPAAAGESLPSSATTPSTATLPTPVDSPAFASALGVHVSLLAKGGVHAAELHLNPAEMGPVSIRIQLDGTEAQVQFGADLAQTRQAIEAGLPELASSLRDAGFTLAGGGVSQHASQRGQGDGKEMLPGAAPAGGGDAEAPGTQTARAIRRFAEGGLDVYA